METISDYVALSVLLATLPVVSVCFLWCVVQDSPRPVKAAFDKTEEIVTRWAVRLAVVLTILYAAHETFIRWGAWELVSILVGTFAGGVAIGAVVVTLQKRARVTPDVATENTGTDTPPSD